MNDLEKQLPTQFSQQKDQF